MEKSIREKYFEELWEEADAQKEADSWSLKSIAISLIRIEKILNEKHERRSIEKNDETKQE